MTTRGDVQEAIERIKAAGGTGQALAIAEAQVLMPLGPQACDAVLAQLRAAYPELLDPAVPASGAGAGGSSPAGVGPEAGGPAGVGPAGRGPVDPTPAAPGAPSPGGPGLTDPTGPGLTDPTGPGLTDPSPAGPASGAGAEAMQRAEGQLAQQLSTTAEFDRRILDAVLAARQHTADGRRRLDDLEAQIAAAARGWDLTTALGAREFQRFLIDKLAEITRVVSDADGDDTAKRALAAALALLYRPDPPDPGTGPTDHAGDRPADRPAGPAGEPLPDPVDPPADLTGWPDEPDPVDELAARPAPAIAVPAPAAPMAPVAGGEPAATPALPAMSAGLPLGALPALLHRPAPTEPADSAPEFDPEPPGEPADPAPDPPADGPGPDDPAPVPPPDTTVHLPDGKTITAATPQLAAVLQAAADGTPIAEAFRRHGITIPAPGTPVSAPVDQAALSAGDIGIFTDRHALALGDARALLDGQIQRVGNIRGPGFLGWQHPPMLTVPAAPEHSPAPTRPTAAADA